jgi:hypothetical protein
MQELDERSRLIQDRRAVHFPDGDVAAGVTPQNVAPAVAVEITCTFATNEVDAFKILVPFISQIATLPVVSCQAMSFLPSPGWMGAET